MESPTWFSKSRWHLALILTVILPLYVANARWSVHGNPDVVAAALPAYELANNLSIDVSGHQAITDNLDRGLDTWFTGMPSGEVISNRPPGLIVLATPPYVVIKQRGFSVGPSTLVALLTTVLAVVLTWNVLIKLVGITRATVATLTLALGTTTWAVSAAQLWPHGPGQLWAALAISSISAASLSGTGWAFAASVTTRPLTALFAMTTGLLESIRHRSWRPILTIWSIASIGVAAVVTYNRYVFGTWSVRGGYSEAFTVGALDRFNLWDYLVNVFQMFIGLPNGVLITTPIIGIGVLGAVKTWKRIPGWARSTALAGVIYLLVHAALNRASGGSLLFYRYPLESIVLAAPLLTLGSQHLWDSKTVWRIPIGLAIGASIILQILHVYYFSCLITDPPVASCILE